MFGQVIPVTFIESERADHKPNGFRTLQLVLQSECCGYLKQDQ